MDAISLLKKYYINDNKAYKLLVAHSRLVANKALQLAEVNSHLDIDLKFLEEAALLHDIGVFKTKAPDIFCFGDQPYICHGYLGAEILLAEGFPEHAKVCERHTGGGLTKEEVLVGNLPIPAKDYLPITIEEKLILVADKFYSKSLGVKEKSLDEVRASLKRFGDEPLRRFDEWSSLFIK